MADALLPLLRTLHDRDVRFVLIGVAGANHYVLPGSPLFVTTDHDLFLPLDPDNLVAAWAACEDAALPPSRIDILSGVTGLVFDQACENRVEISVADLTVPVIGRADFVANKRASGRPKDLSDLTLLPPEQP